MLFNAANQSGMSRKFSGESTVSSENFSAKTWSHRAFKCTNVIACAVRKTRQRSPRFNVNARLSAHLHAAFAKRGSHAAANGWCGKKDGRRRGHRRRRMKAGCAFANARTILSACLAIAAAIAATFHPVPSRPSISALPFSRRASASPANWRWRRNRCASRST